MMALNKLFKTLGYAYKPLLKKLGVSLPIICLEGLLQRADIVLSNLKDVSTIFRADILSSGLTFLVILVFFNQFYRNHIRLCFSLKRDMLFSFI